MIPIATLQIREDFRKTPSVEIVAVIIFVALFFFFNVFGGTEPINATSPEKFKSF